MIATRPARRAAPRVTGLLIPLVPLQPGPADVGPPGPGPRQPASDAAAVPAVAAPTASVGGALADWVAHVAGCADRVFLLDRAGRFVAASASAAALVGAMPPTDLAGRPVLECLRLVDFGSPSGDGRLYANRIAPLLALASDAPNRGLLRLRGADRVVTVDVVAVPLHDRAGGLVGVLTFLYLLA